MKKALFITMHQLEGFSGGSMASRNFLKLVYAAFNGDVRVVAANESEDVLESVGVNDMRLVPSRGLKDKLLYFLKGECQDRFSPYCNRNLQEILEGITHAILDGSMLGRFSKLIKTTNPRIHVCQLHHNFEKKYYADTKANLFYRYLQSKIIDKNQGGGWLNNDLNLVFTSQDKSGLESSYGVLSDDKVDVFGYFEECMPKLERTTARQKEVVEMIITGNMSVRKGYEGAIWFIEEVLPSLNKSQFRLKVAGRNPHPDLVAVCSDNGSVELIANPDNMEKLVAECDVFVNPSSIGSGIKVRNLDGLKQGIPVICREGNNYGFELLSHSVFTVFQGTEDFEEELMELLESDKNVYSEYERVFSLKSGVTKLHSLLDL